MPPKEEADDGGFGGGDGGFGAPETNGGGDWNTGGDTANNASTWSTEPTAAGAGGW